MKRDTILDAPHVPHGGSPTKGAIDFSANINPHIPNGTKEKYLEAIDDARSYPPEPPSAFIDAAADYLGVSPTTVIPTAGGLAGIRLTLETLISPDERVAIPYPSFSEYEREATLQGCQIEFVPHDEILTINPTDFDACFVCNPNNPTGDTYTPASLRAFADKCTTTDTLLIVDEAFLGFTDQPTMASAPNTIVIRSLTKLFGLPGLRAGFIIAPDPYAELISTARRPWNLGTPALSVGSYVMQQDSFIETTIDRTRTERKRLCEQLSEQYIVSQSNAPFLLLEPEHTSLDTLIDACRNEGLIIRDARSFRGLNNHCRIAIRTPTENDQLISVLLNV